MANVRGLETFFKGLDESLEAPVKLHLRNVYSCLSLSLLVAAAGGYVHLFTSILQGGIFMSLVGFVFVFLLMATPDDGKNSILRLSYLMGFAFTSGLSLGPLMDIVIRIDPSIIATAFLGTSLVFVCFTISALIFDQRRYLYIGGTLMSGLSMILFLGCANLFLGSLLLFQIHLYLGLGLMCAFILYDTQMIVQKRRDGDKDYIWHSVDLFIDFLSIFRRLLVILSQKESKKKNQD